MNQLLANELLLVVFKELLYKTSFKYMNSISTVCKKWKDLIKLVLIEEIEYSFKSELLTKVQFLDYSIDNITPIYNPSNSTFTFQLNDRILSYVPNDSPILDEELMIVFDFKDQYNYELVKLNLGSLLLSEEKISDKKYELKCSPIWNHEDCLCVYTEDIKDNPDSLVIKFENLILSLKRMCVILDILDEKESEHPGISLISRDVYYDYDYYDYDYDYDYTYDYTYNYTYNYNYDTESYDIDIDVSIDII